ncbi:hypothetical protein ACE193_18985 [Bernardetia sp. OM2101]|uniref:hypothetical protein n=1 Tax=Bernardetia sp. OM2101 TaxID=3344876 RepID=UPI0035D08E97
MTILDNKFAKVTYHEDGNYILFEYKKFGTSEAFREAWNKAAEVAEKYQVNKWVSDSRKMAVISPEDQQWFSEDWSPRVRNLVSKDTYTAIVLDKGVFTEISAKSISQNIVGQNSTNSIAVTFEYFKDIDAAQDWLKNIEYQLEPLAR